MGPGVARVDLQTAAELVAGVLFLGVILGPMMDSNYRRAMIGAKDDVGTFLVDFVTHPISLVLTIALLLLLLAQTPLWRWLRPHR
jgi:putative tricarboxylic transport membrane protein